MLRKIETLGKILITFIFLAAGIGFFVANYHVAKVESGGDDWITASTTITYTYGKRAYGGRTVSSGVEYVLSPTYSFTALDGKTYSGNEYNLFGDGKTERKIGTEEELKKHLVEHGVIYYNPKDPRQSAVMRPYLNPPISIALGIIAIFIIYLGLHLVVDEFKQLKSHKERHSHPEYR